MRAQKRRIKDFIESCLLRNQDIGEGDRAPSSCLRRTLLRSLMLVLLLDKAKETKTIPSNLFLSSSQIKCSRGVIRVLTSLLLPSVGDLCRPLSQLETTILIISNTPSRNFDYGINNLATDYRDGIRLTRLAVLLLFSPRSLTERQSNITLALPSGNILLTAMTQDEKWPISHYLMYPAAAKSQKLYNVQIALSVLCDSRYTGNLADECMLRTL